MVFVSFSLSMVIEWPIIVRHSHISYVISNLWKINVFHHTILPPMEALHSREGDSHPYGSQAYVFHADIRKIVEWMSSKVVHILAVVSPQH